jgi:hypothetical protein
MAQEKISASGESQGQRARYRYYADVALDSLVTLGTSLKSLVNSNRAAVLNRVTGNPTLVINSNFDIKTSANITYTIAGIPYNLPSGTSIDTGTAATTPTTKWIAGLIEVNSSGTVSIQYTAGNLATEAAALTAMAALTPVVATKCVIGCFTVQAAGATWLAGTDALASGTGGTPATTTNYYNGVCGSSAIGSADATTIGATPASARSATDFSITPI